ncbi:MAG TPA: squalene/phytoene synthase family protein [Hyphomicrobiaceae bacterium]|nr:squalene/phytoene synthase family protein [Hyphomicrobiaceae bacterium]
MVRIAARAYERDRYLAALLAPRTLQLDLIALAAFGGEVARIPAFVNEPMMGEVRLRWWRDALAEVAAGNSTGHPVADAVGATVRRHRLPTGLLEGFIEATALRLYEVAPADDEALRSYLGDTEGALFALTWRILAGADGGSEPEFLAMAGQAYGLARLVYEFSALLAQGRTLVPLSRLENHGISVAELCSGVRPHDTAALLAEIAADARRNLAAVAPILSRVARPLRTALLPIALVEPYLRFQQRGNLNRPDRTADISPLTRVWRIWWAHRTGRF